MSYLVGMAANKGGQCMASFGGGSKFFGPLSISLSEKSDSELVDLSFSNFFLAFVGLLPSGSETGHLFEAEKLRN